MAGRAEIAAAEKLPDEDHADQWQRVGHLGPQHEAEERCEPQPGDPAVLQAKIEEHEQQREGQKHAEVDVQHQRALDHQRAQHEQSDGGTTRDLFGGRRTPREIAGQGKRERRAGQAAQDAQ